MEYERKHRIAGAVVLLLGFTLIIPMILREPTVQTGFDAPDDEPTFASQLDSPTMTTGALKPLETEQKEPEVVMIKQDIGAEETLDTEVPLEAVAVESEESGIQESIDEQPQPDTASSETKAQPVPDSQTPQEQWIVRVGTFAKPNNVTSVTALLGKNGFEANLTPIDTSIGKATRVWLGPFPDIATAKKISGELKKLIGEEGYVTPHGT